MRFDMIWKIHDHSHDLSRRGWIMGVLNVTPDSFSDGGQFVDVAAAVSHGLAMVADGADVIDIGGESTRPGATPVPEDEEIRRVVPVLLALRGKTTALLSIDTSKPAVAAAAVAAGADIINNVAGFSAGDAMLEIVKKTGAGLVCMHMQGTPTDMQQHPHYEDVTGEVRRFFEEKLSAAITAGIDPARIVFDPGIGFGKTLEHNLNLLRHLPLLRTGNRPMLIGVSRKSFIGKILGSDGAGDRLPATIALTAWCRSNGAEIFRVHDVRPNRDSLRMMEAIDA